MGGKKRKAEPARQPPPKSLKALPPQGAKEAMANIFAALKDRPKPPTAVPSAPAPDSVAPAKATARHAKAKGKGAEAPKSRKAGGAPDSDPFSDSRGLRGGRKVVDGIPVYSPEELGLGAQGGDTPLCPFDCECCV